jgi:hypothetical protein
MSDEHAKALTVIERTENKAMSPVVAAGLEILRNNPSPETLRELLKVQQEWEANEARKLYVAARNALTADLPRILHRNKKVDFNTTHYSHTTLDFAIDAVVPHLIKHGFSHDWRLGNSEDGQVQVTCRLTHIGGHHEEVTLKAEKDTKGGKNGPQAVASSATMLERYTLLGILGIATADMHEPTGAPDAAAPDSEDTIDSKRNLTCLSWLMERGRTKPQAEAHVDKPMTEWNQADRDKLRAWAKSSGEPDRAA